MPTLDEMIAENKTKHTCLKKFQKFMECMTPKHQFTTYYRFGTYEDCPKHMASWQICMRAKVRTTKEQADADRLRDWRSSVDRFHVLPFKPIYREEAYERYGVIVAEEADVNRAESN